MDCSFETASYFVDDLLNFSSDIEEEYGNFSSRNGPLHHSKTNAPEKDYSFPDLDVEEELEWLSNEDAFPKLESFDVALRSPKHQSPVSVLESSVGSTGIRVPVRARSKRGSARSKRGRRNWYGLSEFLIAWGEGRERKKKGAVAGDMKRKCLHCLSEKTPQWRAGPLGPKTLCNACGVRFKAGRLVPEYRPANSPSFSGDLHSNSHRKILEMRRRKQKTLENG